MEDRIITSLLTLILPLIATYLSKMNKEYQLKSNLEAAQKKLDFINSYYETVNKMIPDEERGVLKEQLLKELFTIKYRIATLHEKELQTGFLKLTTLQKIFLTFKPASTTGLILLIFFYVDLVYTSLLLIGMFVDANNNFSYQMFVQNLQDSNLLIALILVVALLLLFRWLAIRNYKKATIGG